jgi:arylsulfatase A-like enzyme
VPPGTALTPRPDRLPAWDEYPERYKPIASRLVEVYAGFLAHTDAQVGRVLGALDELEITENTLFVYITGDNGASGEGGIDGAVDISSWHNGIPEDLEWMLGRIEDLGSDRCECHYNAAWAWALDSPFQWMKQVASHFGGTRNALVVSWPAGIRDSGGLRSQFHHVIDIVPTLLEAAGIKAPQRVNGLTQLPIDGKSMVSSFEDPESQEVGRTQYFEMYGNRAIYKDGWLASCFHGRAPWERFSTYEFDKDEEWELYNIKVDFSQAHNLSIALPDKMAEMRRLFEAEAERCGVYPMRDRPGPSGGAVPHILDGITEMTYTTAHFRMPEVSV